MHDDGSFVCAHGALSPPEVKLARANFVEFDVDGDGLISHQDFVEYLLAKRYASGGAVRHAILPFAGRNQCVWGVPGATSPE